MRLLTYRDGAGTRAGVRVDGGVAPTPYPDLLALVRDGDAGLAAASRAAASGEVVRDASPVAPLVRRTCTRLHDEPRYRWLSRRRCRRSRTFRNVTRQHDTAADRSAVAPPSYWNARLPNRRSFSRKALLSSTAGFTTFKGTPPRATVRIASHAALAQHRKSSSV